MEKSKHPSKEYQGFDDILDERNIGVTPQMVKEVFLREGTVLTTEQAISVQKLIRTLSKIALDQVPREFSFESSYWYASQGTKKETTRPLNQSCLL